MVKIISFFWVVISAVLGLFNYQSTVPYNPDDYKDELPSYVIEGEVRVELLSDSLVRIETRGARGFENRPSFTVEKRSGWSKVEFTKEKENGYTLISTDEYTVYVPENAASAKGCLIKDKNGNELWRFETDTTGNILLPSPSDELNSWYFTDSPRVIPSEDGYSVAKNLYDNNGWDLTNDAQDMFVFLPGGSYETFTKDFTDLTGKSEMLTLNLLGYWDSRYFEYSQGSAWQQIEDYRNRDYPLDVLVIDTDWRLSTGGTGYNINRFLFPTFEQFAKKVHKEGISLVFNDHPEPTSGNENLLEKYEMFYRTSNLQKHLKKGLDYWWYDRNWWITVNPIADDLSVYTTGMYAYRQITKDYYDSLSKSGEYPRRPLIMANVDGINNGSYEYPSELAAHRYSLQWTGDIAASSDSLEQEINNMIFMGSEMGLPYTSSDLGGHTSEVTKEMYVRWLQYGALSPICRVHCTKPYSRMPWLYGETAEKVTHDYVNMRYRLLPIYYQLAHENYVSGLPLLRRVDISYPQYAEADSNSEYLLGDSILVAPLSNGYPEAVDYTFTSEGKAGLKGEYFNNDTFSGEPEITRQDEKIYFNWDLSAPFNLSVSDYFSVRWTGELNVGDKPIFFSAFADDGIRVWIDNELVVDGWNVFNTYFQTDFIPANSTHSIKVEYCDGNEHAHIYLTAFCEGEVSRDVFIPDGKWMDIWTGETFTGPSTVTVSHGLETSPVFVRMGSVLTLADNMKNTNEKDWSHLTLEVFPSEDYDAAATLYEDDVTTVAYKSGEYRTTDITLDAGRTQTLTINPSKGTFSGNRAFAKRSYTVRVHARDDWGKLTGMTLNGKSIDFETVKKNPNAEPLAIIGGARDNDVYEVAFSEDVDKQSVLTFTFESTAPDGKNEDYDSSEAEIALSVNKLEKATASFEISENSKDFAIYGINWEFDEVRKKESNNSIGEITCEGREALFDDNYEISWKDGNREGINSTTCGRVAYNSFKTTLKSGEEKTAFKLYLGGFESIGKLTVRDRSGNTKTVSFGDMNSNYYREVIIEAEGNSELEVTYSLLCGLNITAAACVAG